MSSPLPWKFDDGGRELAGYKGRTGDCGARALAIVTGWPYQDVYDLIIDWAKTERPHARRRRSHPRTGVHASLFRRKMPEFGFVWVPTMQIGSGTTVHLRVGELPDEGRLLVNCSRHFTAVIDGVIHDTHDPSRDGTRAVYGYFTRA